VYRAAKAATEGLFKHHMNEVKKLNDTAYNKLVATPHNTWANYACRKNVIWDQTTSNTAESTNHMIGEEVRCAGVLGYVLLDPRQPLAFRSGAGFNPFLFSFSVL